MTKSFPIVICGLLLSSLLLSTMSGDEPEAKSDSSIEEWEKEIQAFATARSKLLRKAEKFLESKREKERIARQDGATAPIEMTIEEGIKYNLAQRSIREMFARAPEINWELCHHLNEKERPHASRRTSPSHAEGFPSARTLMELDPRTSKSLADIGGSCDSAQMQYLVGALLYELDGKELAKARLDIKIKELSDSKDGTKERTLKAITNLQAIRKLFDNKDAFKAKRV